MIGLSLARLSTQSSKDMNLKGQIAGFGINDRSFCKKWAAPFESNRNVLLKSFTI